MNAKIVRIGNSNGIVIPSSFLKMLGISSGTLINLEIREKSKEIVIKPEIRVGWADAFRNYAKKGEDELLIPDVFDDEDFNI